MVARPVKAGITAPMIRCVAERQLIPDLPIDANITIGIYSAACDSDIIDDREGDKDEPDQICRLPLHADVVHCIGR